MTFAIIENGIVINIAFSNYSVNENWMPIGDLPVHIGDTYVEGLFYRDGEQVMTEEEQLRIALEILLGEVSA